LSPDISVDDLELFFEAATTRSSGSLDLYVATREDAGQPFTDVKALSEVNLQGYDEISPDLSGDRLTVFWSDFDVPRPGGQGSADLWMASRPRPDQPFGIAGNVGFPVNTSAYDASPCISADWPAAGSELYFVRLIGDASTADIYVATWHLDCNDNDIDDTEDIASGFSDDVNGDGIPDECEPPDPPGQFRRGNANADADLNIADAVFVLTYLFAQGPAPPCEDAADGNDDGKLDLADAIAVLTHLFAGGTVSQPFDQCGPDPTPDDLDCASFPPCDR
jgi:hypothetical protein